MSCLAALHVAAVLLASASLAAQEASCCYAKQLLLLQPAADLCAYDDAKRLFRGQQYQ